MVASVCCRKKVDAVKIEKIKAQGRSQNLKSVPQNFMEVFEVDDITGNDVI